MTDPSGDREALRRLALANASQPAGLREALKEAVTKHCHINMKWPATAVLDDSHIEQFTADVLAALSLPEHTVHPDSFAAHSIGRQAAAMPDPAGMRKALETIARTTFSGIEMGDDYQRGNRDAHQTCARMARVALAVPQPPAPTPSDFERAFIDACDEAGCARDNEALLQAIADLKKSPAPLGMREEVAAFLFARDEALILEGVTPDLLQWGRSQVHLGTNAVHSGDCTNECYSCARCAYDFAVRDADAILAAVTPTAPVSDRAAALQSLEYWCTDERSKIGAVDGYDYRSGEEYGIRKVEIEIGKRIRALVAKGDAK